MAPSPPTGQFKTYSVADRFRTVPTWIQVGLLVVAVVVAFAIFAVLASPTKHEVSPNIKANYARWRVECEQRATDTLDTSLYRVGGQHWADGVNRCLLAKAGD